MTQDQRALRRIQNRFGPETSARIKIEGRTVNCEVLDFNSVSISLKSDELININAKVSSIEILYGREVISEIMEPIVKRHDNERGVVVLRLRSAIINKNANRKERILLSQTRQGSLTGKDPFSNDLILFFRVAEISEDGVKLISSKANRHLVPGVLLENFSLTLPGRLPCLLTLKIMRVDTDDQHLILGCSFQKKDKKTDREIKRLLFSQMELNKISTYTPGQIKHEIRKIKKFRDQVYLSIASTKLEIERVKEIRFCAYKAANKTKADQSVDDMLDSYDEHSLIYIAKIGVNIVGTVRLVMRSEGKRLPFEEYYNIEEIAALNASSCAEVSKFAIDPLFQGTDLFLILFQKMLFESGAKEIQSPVCIATRKLSPYYESIGAVKLAAPVPHPTIPHETLTLFLFDRERVMKAQMDALGWFLIASPALKLLKKFGFIESYNSGLKRYLSLPFDILRFYWKKRGRR